jgi:hypothetical protein
MITTVIVGSGVIKMEIKLPHPRSYHKLIPADFVCLQSLLS